MNATALITSTGKTESSVKSFWFNKGFNNQFGSWSKTNELPIEFINAFTEFAVKSGNQKTDKPVGKTKASKTKRKTIKKTTENQANKPNKETSLNQAKTEIKTNLFSNEWFRLGAVLILLFYGAGVFSKLCCLVYPSDVNYFYMIVFFAVGFLVDASGIVLASSYKKTSKFDEAVSVWFFLSVLFMVQLAIGYSFWFYETDFNWPGAIIVLAHPLGQMVYSKIYLNQNNDTITK